MISKYSGPQTGSTQARKQGHSGPTLAANRLFSLNPQIWALVQLNWNASHFKTITYTDARPVFSRSLCHGDSWTNGEMHAIRRSLNLSLFVAHRNWLKS